MAAGLPRVEPHARPGGVVLAPENQTEATALLQLARGKDGLLRGTYHDLLGNADHPIRGSVGKATQRAAWTFGPHGKVTFQTAIAVLTEPSGPVSVHYENGLGFFMREGNVRLREGWCVAAEVPPMA